MPQQTKVVANLGSVRQKNGEEYQVVFFGSSEGFSFCALETLQSYELSNQYVDVTDEKQVQAMVQNNDQKNEKKKTPLLSAPDLQWMLALFPGSVWMVPNKGPMMQLSQEMISQIEDPDLEQQNHQNHQKFIQENFTAMQKNRENFISKLIEYTEYTQQLQKINCLDRSRVEENEKSIVQLFQELDQNQKVIQEVQSLHVRDQNRIEAITVAYISYFDEKVASITRQIDMMCQESSVLQISKKEFQERQEIFQKEDQEMEQVILHSQQEYAKEQARAIRFHYEEAMKRIELQAKAALDTTQMSKYPDIKDQLSEKLYQTLKQTQSKISGLDAPNKQAQQAIEDSITEIESRFIYFPEHLLNTLEKIKNLQDQKILDIPPGYFKECRFCNRSPISIKPEKKLELETLAQSKKYPALSDIAILMQSLVEINNNFPSDTIHDFFIILDRAQIEISSMLKIQDEAARLDQRLNDLHTQMLNLKIPTDASDEFEKNQLSKQIISLRDMKIQTICSIYPNYQTQEMQSTLQECTLGANPILKKMEDKIQSYYQTQIQRMKTSIQNQLRELEAYKKELNHNKEKIPKDSEDLMKQWDLANDSAKEVMQRTQQIQSQNSQQTTAPLAEQFEKMEKDKKTIDDGMRDLYKCWNTLKDSIEDSEKILAQKKLEHSIKEFSEKNNLGIPGTLAQMPEFRVDSNDPQNQANDFKNDNDINEVKKRLDDIFPKKSMIKNFLKPTKRATIDKRLEIIKDLKAFQEQVFKLYGFGSRALINEMNVQLKYIQNSMQKKIEKIKKVDQKLVDQYRRIEELQKELQEFKQPSFFEELRKLEKPIDLQKIVNGLSEAKDYISRLQREWKSVQEKKLKIQEFDKKIENYSKQISEQQKTQNEIRKSKKYKMQLMQTGLQVIGPEKINTADTESDLENKLGIEEKPSHKLAFFQYYQMQIIDMKSQQIFKLYQEFEENNTFSHKLMSEMRRRCENNKL